MHSESPLTLDEEFANLTRYFANHMRHKEVHLMQAINDGDITTEEERDTFLMCTEPLEEGFKELPESDQVITELPYSSEETENYAERMVVLSEKASYLRKRSEDLSKDIDPEIHEFIKNLAEHNDYKSKMRARAKGIGIPEDQIESEIGDMDLSFDDLVEDMNALDAFILKARQVMGDPDPISVPGTPAP